MEHVLLGNHSSIEKIRELITMVSDTAFNVLLLGDTGTGKEVVARLLHQVFQLFRILVTVHIVELQGPRNRAIGSDGRFHKLDFRFLARSDQSRNGKRCQQCQQGPG